MPETLARMDVGKVDLDGRHASGRNGISQGDAGMSVGGGVEDQGVELVLGLLNPADQLPFIISLSEIDRYSSRLSSLPHASFNLLQAIGAVDVRFALTEEIEVGSIEKQDSHAGASLSRPIQLVDGIRSC